MSCHRAESAVIPVVHLIENLIEQPVSAALESVEQPSRSAYLR